MRSKILGGKEKKMKLMIIGWVIQLIGATSLIIHQVRNAIEVNLINVGLVVLMMFGFIVGGVLVGLSK